jgi:hypothetical protein
VVQCRLGIVPGAGNESDSRANLRPGAYIVRIVDLTRGDIMDLSEYDETQLDARWRLQCWRNGNRIKSRKWLDEDGAGRDTSENKIVRSAYKKMMLSYWESLNPSYRERAERMSIYVNYPVPSRALAISLKKQGANAPGVLDTGATKHERNGSAR